MSSPSTRPRSATGRRSRRRTNCRSACATFGSTAPASCATAGTPARRRGGGWSDRGTSERRSSAERRQRAGDRRSRRRVADPFPSCRRRRNPCSLRDGNGLERTDSSLTLGMTVGGWRAERARRTDAARRFALRPTGCSLRSFARPEFVGMVLHALFAMLLMFLAALVVLFAPHFPVAALPRRLLEALTARVHGGLRLVGVAARRVLGAIHRVLTLLLGGVPG